MLSTIWFKILRTKLGYRIAYSLFTGDFSVWIGPFGKWKEVIEQC